ncbi:MAG: ABC transporter ATP-binding protein [Bacilli bacterium]
MATLKLEHVTKVYPGGRKRDEDVIAVRDFNLEVQEKEFIVFVGPSGCGKSTTLRMIAGLEEITTGKLFIDGELMNQVEPKYRNIAMVFQNYALYPHMTAYQNMEFGLKNMRIKIPRLDPQGEPIRGIDHTLLKMMAAERKRNQKQIQLQEKLQSEIAVLTAQIQADHPSRKLEKLNRRLRKLSHRFDGELLDEYYKKDEEIRQDQAYFSTHEIPLFKDGRLTREEIDTRIRAAAKILDIEELLERRPKAMSGGQRQRVALGRAIVRRPKLFLLDEPLSNLDAKLRAQMRIEITNLYHQLDTTFIYVTHDQVEAMTMGTRIVVMHQGIAQQIDTPTNLYDFPKNRFVAGFLGTPQMNFFEAQIQMEKHQNIITLPGDNRLEIADEAMRKVDQEYDNGQENAVIFGIRPEDIKLVESGGIKVYARLGEILGSETLIYADLLREERHVNLSDTSLVIKVPKRMIITHGEELHVEFPPSKIHLFSARENEGEKSILH